MKKKNVIGAFIMAAAIVLSLPLGANRSFDRLREETLDDAYYYDSTGYAIYEGLEKQVGTARNFLTLAERYVERFPELDPYIDELSYRAEFCENFYGPGEPKEVESYRLLVEASQALYEQLEKVELDEKDAKYPGQLIAAMESERDKLMRSSYNDGAREYNAKLQSIPAGFLAELTGAEPMGVFE